MRTVILMCYVIALVGACFGRTDLGNESMSTIFDFESFDFQRSVLYVLPEVDCVAVTGDGSRFHESFLFAVHRLRVLPIMVYDWQAPQQCNGTLVAAEDPQMLYRILQSQSRCSARYYCVVRAGTMSSLRRTFKDHTKLLHNAEVAIFWNNQYKIGLKIAPPQQTIDSFRVPSSGSWLVQDEELRKREIRFTTANCSIFGKVVDEPNPDPYNPGHFGGVDFKIFSAFARRHNYSMTYIPTNPQSPYLGVFNGSWTGGLLGSLVNNTVDVAFCGFWLDWRKHTNGIKLTVPTRKVCITYIVPRPTITGAFTIFSPTVMAVLTITVVTVSIILSCVYHSKYSYPTEEKGYSWKYCFVTLWGILCQSSYPSKSADKGPGGRILRLWSVFSLFVACCYSSHLVSNITHPKWTEKPRSVRDLVAFDYSAPYYSTHPDTERGTQDTKSGAFVGIFDISNPVTLQWIRRTEPLGFEELVETLRTKPKQTLFGYKWKYHRSIFFIPGFTIRPMPAEVLARYEIMDSCARDVYSAFAVREASGIYDQLNNFLTLGQQFGFTMKMLTDGLDNLAQKYPALRNVTVSSTSTHHLNPIAMKHLNGVFMSLIIGLSLAAVMFACELAFPPIRNPKETLIHNWSVNYMLE